MSDKVGEECYIAYFDILGYRQYIKQNKSQQELYNKIRNIVNKCYSTSFVLKTFRKTDIQIKAFSDCFVLAVKVTEDKNVLSMFVSLLNNMQYNIFAELGLLIRGGFTKGLFVDNGEFVFGEGLLKAVELEETAVYPRILIDTDVFDIDNFDGDSWKDHDGKYFINSFNYIDSESFYAAYRQNLIEKIKDECYYRSDETTTKQILARERIINKISWVLSYYNYFVYGHLVEEIKYKIQVNMSVNKYEIILQDKEGNKDER